MKLSTRGRYGLRVMIELADGHANGRPVRGETLAGRQTIPRPYLHQLLARLRAAGLVRAIQGRGGGYVLARPAESITARDVLQAIEGPIAPVDCVVDEKRCRRAPGCAARELWMELASEMDRVLSSATLERLAGRQEAVRPASTTYEI